MRQELKKLMWAMSALLLTISSPGAGEEFLELPRPIVMEEMQLPSAVGKQYEELPQRNPFAASNTLVQRAMQPKTETPAPRAADPIFTPLQTVQQKLPEMRLRGHLHRQDGEMVALLQIGKEDVHIVREGDTVGIHDSGIDSVIRVKQINRLHLVIESGLLERLVIVR